MDSKQIHNFIKFGLIRLLGFPVILISTSYFIGFLSTKEVISKQLGVLLLILVVILAFSFLIVFLIRETKRLHVNGQTLKRNINIGIIIFHFLVLAWGYDYISRGEFEYAENSPCGKYKLEVYTHPHIFALPGGGGFYSRSTTVILKTKWGWRIGRSDASIYSDLEIEWDYVNNCVWTSRGNAIDF